MQKEWAPLCRCAVGDNPDVMKGKPPGGRTGPVSIGGDPRFIISHPSRPRTRLAIFQGLW